MYINIFCTFSYMKLFILINVLIGCLFAFSQQDSSYVITYYDSYYGLPQNTILDIALRKKQFITVSTNNGIVNFDGERFYEFIESQEYKNAIYNRIAWHPKKKILYGYSNDGAYRELFPSYEHKNTLQAIYFGDTSITYITQNGTIIESDYELTKKHKTTQTKIIGVHAIFDTKTAYYIANAQSLYKIDKNTGKTIILNNDNFKVKRIRRNPYTQEIYFLSKNTLFIINKNEKDVRQINIQNGRYVNLEDISFINDTTSVIASTQGIITITNHHVRHHYSYKSYTIPPLYCIYYHQEEKSLLIGTETHGLMKLLPKNSHTFIQQNNFNTQSFVSIVEHGQYMYSAYQPGNIVRFDENGNFEDYLSITDAIASLSWIDDKLYVGTWASGLLVYKNKELIQHFSFPALPSRTVCATFKDSLNNVWIATQKGVVRQTFFGEIEKIQGITKRICVIYQLKNGTICLGGDDGFYIVKNNKVIEHVNNKDGLICREVRSFYEDQNNILWIGTYNGGLYRYDPKEKKLLSINNLQHCMLNENVFTIVKGKDDMLYMSSNRGVYIVQEKKLNDFSNGTLSYLIPFFIGRQTGIENMEFNGGFQNNSLQSSRNTLFFPSIFGIVKLSQTVSPFRELYPVFTSHSNNSEIVFNPNTRHVSFEFHAFSCMEQYNLFYQYRLVGKNKSMSWSEPQKEKHISMTLLPADEYQLFLRAIDGFNDKFPQETVLNFTILPRFYETLTFKIATIILAFVLLFYLIIRYIRRTRINDLHRHKVEQTMSELKIHNLQLQMNPHFIFNSLNNIIYLLNVNKLQEAERILIDFSRLLRKYLEQSTHSFLTVAEELEIIRLYLEIQKQRFQERFTYSILCPEELLKEQIPSMLMQPFVENAIVHGFAHSEERGELIISVEKTDSSIQLTITDNGIGRKRSSEINKNRKNHESLGMDIVKQKVETIYQKYKINIELLINDLTQGTAVTVKINNHKHENESNNKLCNRRR